MWSLHKEDKFLKPLCFSNGKSQEEIVKEVLDAVEKGNKVIFIHGVCGTGKSAIALNIARKLGKASVVVPGKSLQEQYKRDYEGGTYLKKANGEKLKIHVITGRKNHKCKFLEDNKNAIPKIRKEIDSNLHDIFEGKREEIKNTIGDDLSADNYQIPCKIEIKEKNWQKIKQYLRQNRNVNPADFLDLKDVKRVSVAGVCPYWCPVVPEKYELRGKGFDNSIKRTYQGLNGMKFVFYQRRPGCQFYEQFNSFIDADVIVFNSMKYKLESAMNRKPLTEVEIIDECDEFLDSFSNQRNINLDRLQNSLVHIFGVSEKEDKCLNEISGILKQLKRDKRIEAAIYSNEIIPLKKTGIYDLFRILLDAPEFFESIDDENYLFDVEETAKMFEDFFNDSYVMFNKKDSSIVASIVTTNLAKKFKEMREKNKVIVLMSGTLHSENVLKNIFGLNNFRIIEAETKNQGTIEVQKTGKEMDCKYSNLRGEEKRKKYLKALSRCVEIAKKPLLVHINAFSDLPTELELSEYDIDNLISREKLKELQREDVTGKVAGRFKAGEMDVLFTTKCSRGVDFPGEQCNSIVFTKYPNPNVQDAFWKILNQTQPQHYWDFYRDKARRELWQRVYRGVRSKGDHVYVLSPDTRVLEAFEKE